MPLKAQFSSKYSYVFVLGLVLLLFTAHQIHLADTREMNALDWMTRLRGAQPASDEITIVEVDDASLAAIGEWPWPRSQHAALLEILSYFHPKLVFFDVLFTEPGGNPADDEALAAQVENLGNVVLPFYYYQIKPFGAFFPIPALGHAAKAIGFVNVEPDQDGVTRRVKAFLRTGEGVFYHPAIQMKLLTLKDAEEQKAWFAKLPLDHQNRFWINYPGPVTSFRRISFFEVIRLAVNQQKDQLEDYFKDRIVMIGHTATGTTDLRPTPFSPVDLGISIQASAVHTLLTGRYLRQVAWPFHLSLLFLLTFSTAWVVRNKALRTGLLFSLGVIVIYAVMVYLSLTLGRIIFPLVIPEAAIVSTYFLMLLIKYLGIRFKEELIGRELKMASRIQEAFLPHKTPDIESVDVAFSCQFAKEVGGDFYDWTDLGEGRLALCIGDVSGKGVPASLYMAKTISEFRREERLHDSAGEVCSALNSSLASTETAGMFVTMLYVVIYTAQREMNFAVAGHDPMVYYHAGAKTAELVEVDGGTPLGLFEGMDYPTQNRKCEPGDLFFMISDGVKELRNPKGEEFGMQRLQEIILQAGKEGIAAAEIIQRVQTAMLNFHKHSVPHDDRTMVCVRFRESK
ncbi:MAG: CHASE2 domain-containing protein [Candidatus Omnitrophica bacterium]|nr:CHASE2 domain-containing protein [Candidatus Omnitrophota bacterium]